MTDNWINLAIEYPPFDILVLVTDGKDYQLRILRKDKNGFKYWVTLNEKNLENSAPWWMYLPKIPE